MRRAHCWLMARLVSTRTLCVPLLQRYFPAGCIPVFVPEWNYSLPDTDFVFHTFEFMDFLESHFSSVSRSLWMAARTADVTSHSGFCIFSRFAECAHCPIIKVIRTGVKHCWTNYWLREYTCSDYPPDGVHAAFTFLHLVKRCCSFQSSLCIYPAYTSLALSALSVAVARPLLYQA